MKRPHSPRSTRSKAPSIRLAIDTLEAREVPANFTPGNLVIYRVGVGGSTALDPVGSAVFLDEYTPTGTLVQSVALPTTASGANKPLIANGVNPKEGMITRTVNGEAIMLTGYGTTLGGSNTVSNTQSSVVPRVVGRVSAFAGVDTSTGLTNFADGNEIRSAASIAGSDFWVVGSLSGPNYGTIGTTTGTPISTTATDLSQISVFGSQLFAASTVVPNNFVGTIGTGTPVTAGQTFATLPSLPTGSPNAFFLADLSPGVSGVDTLYVADDIGGLLKFSLVGGAWVSNGGVGGDSDDYRGLTATLGPGPNVVNLFATRKATTLGTGGGEFVTMTDTAGYNQTIDVGTSLIVRQSAANNTGFRGIALAPVKVNAPPIGNFPALPYSGLEDIDLFLTGITINDNDSGSGNIEVVLSVDNGTLTVNTGVGSGVTAGQVSNNNSASVTILAPLAAISNTLSSATGLRFELPDQTSGTANLSMSINDKGNSGTDGEKTDFKATTITIQPVNDAPTFVVGNNQSHNEDPGAITITNFATSISPGPADESSQLLTFNVSNDNNALFSVQPSISPTGTLTYTPADNVSGTATVTVTLEDDGGGANGGQDTSPQQTFTILVRPSNDAPTFDIAGDVVVNEDTGSHTINSFVTNLVVGPTDEAAQLILSAPVTNDNPTLFDEEPFLDVNTRQLKFTLAPNAFGVANVTLRLRDNGGTANGGSDLSVVKNFTITVNQVNDQPSFTKGGNQNLGEDAGPQTIANWATNINPGVANESGQTLTFEFVPDNPALFISGPAIDPNTGTLTYTPAPNAVGTSNVTVRLKDNGGTDFGGSDTSIDQTFTVTITGVNDAPTFVKGADIVIDEDAGPQSIANWATSITNGGLDEATQTLTFTLTTNNDALFDQLPQVDSTGKLSFTTKENVSGTASVNIFLKDNGGTTSGGQDTSGTQSFTITVNAVNDAPIMSDALFYLNPVPAINDVIGTITATDVENHTITYSITSDPNNNFAINPSTGEITLVSLTGLLTVNTITVKATDNGSPNAESFATVDIRSNTSPVLDLEGTPMLASIPVRGKVLPEGSLLSLLTTYSSDVDPNSNQGVAVIGIDNAKGIWQYNLTGDANGWINIPAVSPTSALLLADDGNTKVRFVPNARFNGFANITFKAWDRTNNLTEGSTANTTTGDTSYSADSDRGWIAVGRTSPTVNSLGQTVLTAVKEDARGSAIYTVRNILGIAGLEAAPATNLGIALTDVSTASGTWKYKLTGTRVWVNVPAVSDTSALLLKPTDQLQFIPTLNKDTEATLTFKTWNQTGTNGTTVDTTVGTDFSATEGEAVLDIIAINDAPILDLTKAAILNPVGANGTTNEVPLSSLMSVTDVENDLNAVTTGVAIFKVAGEGAWQYKDGAAWVTITGVSTAKALHLNADTEIRFRANPILSKPATTAALLFKAWDKSVNNHKDVKPIRGTAYSTGIEVVTVAVQNTAPAILDGNPVLPNVRNIAKPGAGTLVRTLLGTNFNDVNTRSLKGIAITFADNTNGQWQYSLGSNKWVAITGVSLTQAILLKDVSRVRFVPNTGFVGQATLKYVAWDQTAGQAGDHNVDLTGVLNSFGTFEETATINVTA